MNSTETRKIFLDFFESKKHIIVPSAPMVIKGDPTLMFTNAGMNQFKDLFLGNAPIKYSRIADTQKCLRVSGKHNDLEEVGVDTYHHTMFEMLGNWSFGDYFKKEAIEWAWELLTEIYKIDKNRLYVTVFEGSKDDSLAFDQEAFDCWKKYISEDRIINGNKKDNFWEMGDTGPCGPCSEIHVDIRDESERKKIDGKSLVNQSHPQVIEIWNLVFMEFNRLVDGSLKKLPAQHVDTGMGFERLCMVLQNKKSNYDTDVFQILIKEIKRISEKKYYPSYGNYINGKRDGEWNNYDIENDSIVSKTYFINDSNDNEAMPFGSWLSQEEINIAMRVISDHIRTISFSIADGQLPSNNGAGYVIRRILRRAVRYGYTFLNLQEPFLCQLVPILVNQLGETFPELKTQQQLIENVILEEEKSFLRTLGNGIIRFEENCKTLKNTKIISGHFAFELFDTFGFPIDLTQLLAREKGFSVNMESYNEQLEKQKNRSRVAANVDTEDWINVNGYAPTDFVGYEKTEAQSKIIQYRKVKAKGKEQFQLVLDKTPFYAESGGQVGDTGFLESVNDSNQKIKIVDTKKEHGITIHISDKLPEEINQTFTTTIDAKRRQLIANNHSATHLLHAALRKVLGTHVEQKGSLVNEEHLRFDFSHFSHLTIEQIAEIEKIVNEKIRENILLDVKIMNIEDAKKTGAMALFGEKYGDEVRVITFDKKYSVELCGGTHVPATGQISLFIITSETAIASGIRRIEARTGEKALNYILEQFINPVEKLKTVLKKNSKDLVSSVENLLKENVQLQKHVENLYREKAATIKENLIQKMKNKNGINFIAEKIDLDSAEAIKDICFGLKSSVKNLFLVLAAEVNGKPTISIIISENIVAEKGWNANTIIRELAKEINGGGGGQAFYATAGGTMLSGMLNVLQKAEKYIG
ncbi:MAG TPA: alanine--tRNA ligase [Bacteroidia bacterium]|nr:alanine--tRNA ligase [Bacteroidia bacterium]